MTLRTRLPMARTVRVTALDGTTQLPFWIESSGSTGGLATVWVQVPSIPLSGTAIFLYYGNPAASSAAAQPESIFTFYDTFNGSSLDPAKWSSLFTQTDGSGTASAVVSGGSLSFSVTSTSGTYYLAELLSQSSYAIGQGLLLEAHASHPFADGTVHTAAELGFATQSRSEMIRLMDYNNPKFLMGANTVYPITRGLSTGYLLHRIYRTTTNSARFALESDPWETLSSEVPTSSLPIWLMVYAVPGYTGRLNLEWVRARSYCGVDTGVLLQPAQYYTSTAVTLQASWNLISLPLQPVSPYDAETWLLAINALGGHCTEIDQWDAGGWVPHVLGMSFPFPITMGKGYFVLCDQPSTWIQQGIRLSSGVTISLSPGYNLISIPHPETGYDAIGLLAAINSHEGSCSEIHHWLNGGWESYYLGLPPEFGNFNILPYEGYFVRCSATSSFTP